QSGPVAEVGDPVPDLQRSGDQTGVQLGRAYAVLDELGLLQHRAQVGAGGGDDAGAPRVRHHRDSVQVGEHGDPLRLGQAAAPGDVGLRDVDCPGGEELVELVPGGALL